MGILLTISTVISLIKRHIGTAEQFVSMIQDGAAIITKSDGTPMSADEVTTAIAKARAQQDVTGAHAAGRIDGREREEP